jgi:hypothetical protein
MALPTLGGVTLYGAQNIRIEKSANIIPLPMPTEDADKTEVFDMLGVVKMISINGQWGGSAASLLSFINSIEALCNGDQQGTTFTSDNTGSVTVMIMSISSSYDVPGTNVQYDIKLVQGVVS